MRLSGNSLIRAIILMTVACVFVIAVGCSKDDDNPTGTGDNTPPVDTTGNGGGNNYADAPPIPKPKTPTDDPGELSEAITTISAKPLTNLSPYVTRALVNWEIATRRGLGRANAAEWCDWLPNVDEELWSDDPRLAPASLDLQTPGCNLSSVTVPSSSIHVLLSFHIYNPFPNWHDLRVNGAARQASTWNFTSKSVPGFCNNFNICLSQYRLSRGYREIQAVPHIRRDRVWVRKAIEGGAGNYLLLSGPVSGDIETSYTRGVSLTETTSFAQTLSISVGGDYKIFSSEVEVTLERSFESSVEISQESSVTFTKHVESQEGKTVQFMVWELVDIYSITDSTGNPLTDPNYEFHFTPMRVGGLAIALDATVWDITK